MFPLKVHTKVPSWNCEVKYLQKCIKINLTHYRQWAKENCNQVGPTYNLKATVWIYINSRNHISITVRYGYMWGSLSFDALNSLCCRSVHLHFCLEMRFPNHFLTILSFSYHYVSFRTKLLLFASFSTHLLFTLLTKLFCFFCLVFTSKQNLLFTLFSVHVQSQGGLKSQLNAMYFWIGC